MGHGRSDGLDPNPPEPDPAAAQGAQFAQWMAPAKDRAKLFPDLMTYTRAAQPTNRLIDSATTLADVRVTGDAATGIQVKPGGKKRTLHFVKQDGAWFLD